MEHKTSNCVPVFPSLHRQYYTIDTGRTTRHPLKVPQKIVKILQFFRFYLQIPPNSLNLRSNTKSGQLRRGCGGLSGIGPNAREPFVDAHAELVDIHAEPVGIHAEPVGIHAEPVGIHAEPAVAVIVRAKFVGKVPFPPLGKIIAAIAKIRIHFFKA